MIPADLASHLRLTQLPTQQETPQPVVSVQKITDALTNLVPGQRIMAEILAAMPNGTYRAMVAQREVTLALPFSAKAGDSLELEVTESDGKVTLAFVANRSPGEMPGKQGDSVATTLSQAGKLIGDLLGGVDAQGKRAAPAPLNGNQPLVDDFPAQAENLAPILKEALSKSGVFYEAHQARWVAGELPTESLRQEPQGKMLPANQPLLGANPNTPETRSTEGSKPEAVALTTSPQSRPEASAQANSTGNPIPRELAPIVQQQLDALATQNYAWQGQIWPGQKMWWEISENPDDTRQTDSEAPARWQTRLKLTLPSLGGIEATLRLHPGGKVEIALITNSESSETLLRGSAGSLHKHLEAAGLDLNQLQIRHGETAE